MILRVFSNLNDSKATGITLIHCRFPKESICISSWDKKIGGMTLFLPMQRPLSIE